MMNSKPEGCVFGYRLPTALTVLGQSHTILKLSSVEEKLLKEKISTTTSSAVSF